jgi:hypothetical protein
LKKSDFGIPKTWSGFKSVRLVNSSLYQCKPNIAN